jgi:hypothetical protein
MSTIEEELTKFKLELSKEWMALQPKWRRPSWIKFPRWVREDMRWIKLSDRAKGAWMSVLLIAVDNPGAQLPEHEFLFRSLKLLGHCPRLDSYSSLINEYIQCGFLLSTTPDYRVQITESKKEEDLNNGCPIKDSVGESLKPIAQPHLNGNGTPKFIPRANLAPKWSIPRFWEITGTAEANRIRTEFSKRPESFRVVLDGGHSERVTAP